MTPSEMIAAWRRLLWSGFSVDFAADEEAADGTQCCLIVLDQIVYTGLDKDPLMAFEKAYYEYSKFDH